MFVGDRESEREEECMCKKGQFSVRSHSVGDTQLMDDRLINERTLIENFQFILRETLKKELTFKIIILRIMVFTINIIVNFSYNFDDYF